MNTHNVTPRTDHSDSDRTFLWSHSTNSHAQYTPNILHARIIAIKCLLLQLYSCCMANESTDLVAQLRVDRESSRVPALC